MEGQHQNSADFLWSRDMAKAKKPQKTRTPMKLSESEQALIREFKEAMKQAPRFPASSSLGDESGGGKIDFLEEDRVIASARVWEAFGKTDVSVSANLLTQILSVNGKADDKEIRETLGLVQGFAPGDPLEATLITQMVATHNCAMNLLRRSRSSEYLNQFNSNLNQANKLLRTYVAQVEALKRYRQKASQTVRVERVYVNEGGQAIVGDVYSRG